MKRKKSLDQMNHQELTVELAKVKMDNAILSLKVKVMKSIEEQAKLNQSNQTVLTALKSVAKVIMED